MRNRYQTVQRFTLEYAHKPKMVPFCSSDTIFSPLLLLLAITLHILPVSHKTSGVDYDKSLEI